MKDFEIRGNTKVFKQEHHDKFDKKGKEVVYQYLTGQEKTIEVVPREDFGVDLKEIIYPGGVERQIIGHEVSVMQTWNPLEGWKSHWHYVRIFERRKRLMRLYPDLFLWILRSDLWEAWVVDASIINWDSMKAVPNSMVKKGELMFHVPKGLCERIYFEGQED